MGMTNGTSLAEIRPTNNSIGFIQILVTLSFVIGILGNIAALIILHRSAKRRNRKHVLMLRWLAINDLVAAVGMFIFTNLKRYNVMLTYWNCVALVLLRGFGLGSGIVAMLMALERWFALTRPFLYQKLITFDVLKRTLCGLWLAALLFTYSPLWGFGLFYGINNKTNIDECKRYRSGVDIEDKIFAWLNFAVGSFVCLSIAVCNIGVMMELKKIRSHNRTCVRRISRSIIVNNRAGSVKNHHQTPEEVAFAKLMAYISVIFCVCWGPQIILIPIEQLSPMPRLPRFFMGIADVLLALYYALDPFVYVLQRYIEKGSRGLLCCFRERRKSNSSLPTTTTTGPGGTAPKSLLVLPTTFHAPPTA